MGDTLQQSKSYLRLASMITGNIGSLPLRTVRYYTHNADRIRHALEHGFKYPPPDACIEATKKFKLLKHLGRLTVPPVYDQKSLLRRAREKFLSRESVSGWDEGINGLYGLGQDKSLRGGEAYDIQLFEFAGSVPSSDDCLMFLEGQGASYLGMPGLILMEEQFSAVIPSSHSYLSFDAEERYSSYHRCYVVPDMLINWSGHKFFHLSQFDSHWGTMCVVVCFTQVA